MGYVLFSYRSTTLLSVAFCLVFRACFSPSLSSAIVSKSAMCSLACVLPCVFHGAAYPVRGDTVQGVGRYWDVGDYKHIHICVS